MKTALTIGLLILLLPEQAAAVDLPDSGSFLRTESAVLGFSGTRTPFRSSPILALDQVGGEGLQRDSEFGSAGSGDDEEDSGPTNLGRKFKAGALSAVLPGAGQYYNGQKKKAFIMAGAEVAIWTAYFVFDAQGDSRMENAREYAGIYAGTQGDHEESYWQSVGRYMDNDVYNDSRLREARALQEEVSGLIDGSDSWQWVNDDRRQSFNKLRADGNSAYDRRDFMILFAVVNRGIAVVDAVFGAGSRPGAIETDVMGMKMGVEMLPHWQDPGARCVVSGSF